MDHTIRRAKELDGLVPADRLPGIVRVMERYSVAITPTMAGLIDPAALDDPIARQFVPAEAELHMDPHELEDPIGDFAKSPVKGLIHRYPDRVLLKVVQTCAVYCRFCFRRDQVGGNGENLSASDLDAAIEYIRQHREIWEVVISGGDPLILSATRLRKLMESLNSIPHLAVIRFHTRVPVVAPDLITDELIASLASEKSVWVVLHINHAREISEAARSVIHKLRLKGLPLLSQSVLLRGVNDTSETLAELFRSLVVLGVKPYYLHHGDLARGTSHFRTTISEGQELVRKLRGQVSGLCQPTYVLDIPGGHGKVPIGPTYATREVGTNIWHIQDKDGSIHEYPPSAIGQCNENSIRRQSATEAEETSDGRGSVT